MTRLASALRPLSVYLGRDPNLWLVVAFSLLAVLPLAGPNYFFDAHDAPHTVFFLTEFDAALRDGVWYPAWATDQAYGYGYPTFTLYSPLAYYGAEAIHLLGATKVAAVKWTWALVTLASGLAMYAYGRRVLGRNAGLLAAVAYVYMPYHLVDIYVRAALAEYSAFIWMPLALLAFHLLAERVTARRVALAGLAYGALWLSHSLTALPFTPLLAAYALFRLIAEQRRARLGSGWVVARRQEWRALAGRVAAMAAAGLLGLGIAAASILPSSLEQGYLQPWQWTNASYNYSLHFVYPFQLFSSFWGYDPALPGPGDGMSLQLGAVPLLLALGVTVSAFRRSAGSRALILFFAIAALTLVLLMLPASAPAWELLPLAALVQFPWRLLALTAVILSILAGMAVGEEEAAGDKQPAHSEARAGEEAETAPGGQGHSAGLGVCGLCLLFVVLGSFGYTLPEYTAVPAIAEGPLLTIEFEIKHPDMVGVTAWSRELPPGSPLVDQYRAGGPLVTAEALAPDARVEMIRAGGASDELWVRSEAGTPLRFYTYFYPGWRVSIDGQRLPDSALRAETPYALLTVDVPPGEHRVLLRWGDTTVRAMGKGLTLACLALALGLVFWRKSV